MSSKGGWGSLVLRKEFENRREVIAEQLKDLGFECRPIAAGNFIKNKVVDYSNFEVHGELESAEYIDSNGLFIGNHHYLISTPRTNHLQAIAKGWHKRGSC